MALLFVLVNLCFCSSIDLSEFSNDYLTEPNEALDLKAPLNEFNSSVVIVWEKCGAEARTQLTQIFKSTYESDLEIIMSYDPSINVIIQEMVNTKNKSDSQKIILNLPNTASGLILFVFREPGKVNKTKIFQ